MGEIGTDSQTDRQTVRQLRHNYYKAANWASLKYLECELMYRDDR